MLGRELEGIDGVVRAKRPIHLPLVLTREEVIEILRHLQGTPWLMASLMYGSGLRVLESARLRGCHPFTVTGLYEGEDAVTVGDIHRCLDECLRPDRVAVATVGE